MTDSAPAKDTTQAVAPDPAAAPAAAAPASATAVPAKVETPPAAVAAPKPADDAAKAAADKAAADAKAQADAKATADAKAIADADASVKAAADKAAADKAAADAAVAAPETYELAPPKGVEFQAGLVESLGPVFKDLKLPKAVGEKLVTSFLEYQKALPAAMLARDLDLVKKDPALGGANYASTLSYVKDGLTEFTTPEFRSKLERWGIANDPEFVRVFAAIGKALRGDEAVKGQPSTAGEESMADRMYRKAAKPNA